MLRGLVVGLGVLVVLAGLFIWFALPPILGGVAVGLLREAGFEAADIRVEVVADPPLRLIGLRADRVRVRASGVEIDRLRAESVNVTLRDVSLRDRTFMVIEGRLDGVRLTPLEGPTIDVSAVQISGPPEQALMTLSLTERDVSGLVRSTVARSFGLEAGDAQLANPDRLSFRIGSERVSGRLAVDERGGLQFIEDRGGLTLELFRSTPSDPARLRSVRIDGAMLEVTGTLDMLATR